MDNRKTIQNSIDYIEENLKTELTAQELADNANFSLFYYYRLFQTAVGIPVIQYIVRRKLLNAIYEMNTRRNITEIALEYGFDTYAGFYKAFKREFGYTPTAFLKTHKVNRPYKINLFKEEHIMVTHKKISEMLTNWDLQNEPITDIFYDNGNRNDNAFYIGNDYVLKLSANITKLKNHIDISKALKNIGLSSAIPIESIDGKEIVEDGELYYILTNHIQGNQIKVDDMYEDDLPTKSRFVGEIIGQLSLALKNVDAIVNDVNIYESVNNWAMPRVKKIMELSDEFCNEYSNTFCKLYDKLPKQIIHRDPNPGNIIIENGKWGFIDFELSERNVRIFDPCYAATGILSESFLDENSEKRTKWIDIYRNIIYGYDSVVKLSYEERKSIPYVVLSNQLITVAWLSEQEKYKQIYETNKEMTKWLIQNFNKLSIE